MAKIPPAGASGAQSQKNPDLMKMSGEDVVSYLKGAGKVTIDRLFKTKSLSFLLMIVMGKVQYHLKTQELETQRGRLERMNDAIGLVNDELTNAKDAANSEKKKYSWPQKVKTLANKFLSKGTELSIEPKIAAEQLSNLSKRLGDNSKKAQNEVSKLQQEMLTMLEAASGAIKKSTQLKEGVARNL